eukprot:TRINITY_DN13390_c0_g1_i1.p1 TRINITY_DN13390_c0_g1~~TRINITY_DN13390_c0_g1_i1.p1  ORF type:complete len:336 (-),score=75.23 TRINITY_DN13390_c0_g1_i1:125-1132(-)
MAVTSTLSSALTEFGLAAVATEEVLRRRYRQLALEHHPDKVRARGGDTEGAHARFQSINAAYKVLLSSLPEDVTTIATPARARATETPREPQKTQSSNGGAAPKGACVQCKKEAFLLNRSRALSMGIDWEEYVAHPDRLQTCMKCKMAQTSVMTQEQACSVFPKLKGHVEVFECLCREGRCFGAHGLKHFWHQDLELRAGNLPADSAKVSRKEAASFAKVGKGEEKKGTKRRHSTEDCKTDDAETGSWKYLVTGNKKLGIRSAPSVDAPPSPGGHLPSGSVFDVSERRRGKDGRTYLKLADGSGWTYDRSAKDFSKVVVSMADPKKVGADETLLS